MAFDRALMAALLATGLLLAAGAAHGETVRCHLEHQGERILSREDCRSRMGLVLGPAAGAMPEAPPPPRAAVPDRDLDVVGTGSGFAINRGGDIVTNFHVVEGCDALAVVHGGETFDGHLWATDEANDLALLSSAWRPEIHARLSPNGPRLAGQVVAAGYPLSDVLGSSLSVTVGYVSALTGFEDDSNQLRFTAAIQPGNSGGPLIDDHGDLVGVNVATLDGLAMAEDGFLPQNVNFAIKTSVLEAFLKAQGAAFDRAAGGASLTPTEIAERAARYTPQVICFSAASAPVMVKQKRAR